MAVATSSTITACKNCKLSYAGAWCKEGQLCAFCKKYLPMRDEYEGIVRDTYECYLWSGWTDEEAYNSQHIAYIRAWCEHWSIRRSAAAEKAEREVLAVRNWTREYMH